MEKKVTTFKEYAYKDGDTPNSKRFSPTKPSLGVQRYSDYGQDKLLKKALSDAEKVVPVRRTPSQVKQFITIVKKQYKGYGGKDKDLLNSFTEKLEQKILESLEESVLTETSNPFKYDHSIYGRDKSTAPRKPSWTRLPVADMLIRNGMSPKEILDLFADKMNKSNKRDKESIEYVIKKGNKSSMLINSFKESIEQITENTLKDWKNNHADIIKNEKKFSRTGVIGIPFNDSGGRLIVRSSMLKLYAIFMKSSKIDKAKKSTAEFAMNSGSKNMIDSILDTVLNYASDKLK